MFVLRPSITYPQAKLHLELLAASFPDNTTTQFTYFDEELNPLCLMGHFMRAHGADTKRIGRIANESYMPTISELVDNYGVIYVDLETLTLLQQVQTYEDQGYTWSDAIKEALRK